MKKADTKLDVKAIVTRFGGRSEICLRLNAIGFEVNKRAVDKWIERNSIPSQALINLSLLGEKEGKSFNPMSYIVLPSQK